MAIGEGVLGGKPGAFTGSLGSKDWGSRIIGAKLGDRASGAGRTGFRMIPYTTGAGNMSYGSNIAGNTHNAIANGQRDGQPTDYRKSFSQVSRVEKKRRRD
jgi:hypothetical protein